MEALLTDRYQLTMLAAYRHAGMHRRRGVFEVFVRSLPRTRSYLVVAGVQRAIDRVLALRFQEEELRYLAEAPGIRETACVGFIDAMRELRFRGAIHAVPDGTVAFPGEPILRVEAALEEAQAVETLVLSVINHDTLVATKAARCVTAARGRPIVEFGSRRTHEHAAVDAALAAYLAGCAGTSNEQAGLVHGVPVYGTVAHSFILAHAEEGEEAAFRSYCRAFPAGALLLVDTYDTLRGVERAIAVAGDALRGVRLDSGDLIELARGARERLDAAGLKEAKVLGSGDLDEYKIEALMRRGAPIDLLGVGTEIVHPSDAPALGAIYKLVAVEDGAGRMRPVAKRSAGKATYPGAKQVFRRHDGDSVASGDVIALADEQLQGEVLLEQIVRDGERVRAPYSHEQTRGIAAEQLRRLPEALRAIPEDPSGCIDEPYPVTRSAALVELLRRVEGQWIG